jgi:EKC/KEOPS complex subunit PCC1/LAGE3
MTNLPRRSTIETPFPDHRLASTALRAIEVDAELSPLVRRTLTLISSNETGKQSQANILCTEYRAATNRMLRVAVNGFMESLGVVLQVMQELDVDVLEVQEGHKSVGNGHS